MSALSEAVGNNAPGHEVEYAGRVYTAFAAIDQAMQTAWDRWLYKRFRDAAAVERDEDGDDRQYEKTLDKLRQMFLRGRFRMLSPLGLKMMRDRQGAGLLKLVAIIFGVEETVALALIGGRPAEVTSLVRTVLAASFPGVKFDVTANGKPADPPDPNASAAPPVP